MICNICGTDNTKTYCPHYPGREYDKDTGKVTCLMTIDGAKEAYELSLVAVPAQPRAGTTKNYGATEKADTEEMPETESDNKDLTTEVLTRIRIAESFFNV